MVTHFRQATARLLTLAAAFGERGRVEADSEHEAFITRTHPDNLLRGGAARAAVAEADARTVVGAALRGGEDRRGASARRRACSVGRLDGGARVRDEGR